MANKNFIQKIFNFSGDSEVKELKDKLENAQDELQDKLNTEVKFIDSDPSFSGGLNTDFSAIDQMIDNAALQKIYCTETWVYAAVNAIAKTISSLPIKLEKRKVFVKKIKNDITGEDDPVKQEVWIDASGEKLHRLFQYPNDFAGKTEFILLLVLDLMTCGEIFIHLDSDADLSAISTNHIDDDEDSIFGRLRSLLAANTPVKGLYRIPPSVIKPYPNKNKPGIECYAIQNNQGTYTFSPSEIIHIKLPNPTNPYSGLSPLIAAFKPVLLDRFSTEHMIRFYKSGARLGGVLETKKNLTKEQMSRYQRSFEAGYTGRQNHHRTLILPADMSYKSIEQNPAETSLLEFCKYNREVLLAAYNVPPIKVGVMDQANYANAFVQLKMFFGDTIIPILTLIEDGINLHKSLMPDNRSYRIKFDLTGVEALQENSKDKATAAKEMIASGLTVNEVRKRVYNAQPITGGDIVIPIEESKKSPQAAGNYFGLSLDKASVDTKDAVSGIQADTEQLSGIKPTEGSMADRVAQLLAKLLADGIPFAKAIAKAIEVATAEGFVPEFEELLIEEAKDGLSTTNNAALVHVDVGQGKPKKPDCNCTDKEDCKCDNEEKAIDQKPSLNEYIADAVSKLSEGEEINQDFIDNLKALYKQTYEQLVDNKEEAVVTSPKFYPNGFTKDTVVSHWKGFIDKTNPLIEKRHSELKAFFNKYRSIVMNRFGANIKSYGAFKARDIDDVDSILDAEAYDKLLDEYIKNVDKALLEAFNQGYNDTLVEVDFGKVPNEEAVKALRKYAAERVKGISDTTRDQLKSMLTDMFENGAAVGDIGKAINEKFAEIDSGRAMTIARTETLTAVSLGKQEKRQDFQNQFPDKKFKKMWISAQDDRVRDSHAEVDGESVDVDAKFSNGLEFPRDPDGPPEEVINCRCDLIDYLEEDEASIAAELPKDEEQNNE